MGSRDGALTFTGVKMLRILKLLLLTVCLISTSWLAAAEVEEGNGHHPELIYVSGMDLMLRGWNGAYQLVQGLGDDEWQLISTSYYGIPIISTKIFKREERWYLNTLEENQRGFKGPEGDSPLGEWGRFLVTDHQDWDTWWRSNIWK